MTLLEFFQTQLIPLFGDIGLLTDMDMGILGTWTPAQIVTLIFVVMLFGCVSHFLTVVPYRLLLRLIQYRRWRG